MDKAIGRRWFIVLFFLLILDLNCHPKPKRLLCVAFGLLAAIVEGKTSNDAGECLFGSPGRTCSILKGQTGLIYSHTSLYLWNIDWPVSKVHQFDSATHCRVAGRRRCDIQPYNIDQQKAESTLTHVVSFYIAVTILKFNLTPIWNVRTHLIIRKKLIIAECGASAYLLASNFLLFL